MLTIFSSNSEAFASELLENMVKTLSTCMVMFKFQPPTDVGPVVTVVKLATND